MQPEQLIPLMRIHDLCRGLSCEDITAIVEEGEFVTIDAGQPIHRSGERLEYLYLVLMGRLKILIPTKTEERKTLRYASSGDQFGALILVTNEESPVDVEVDEKAVMFRIKRDRAMELGDQFPVFRRNLFRKIGYAVLDSVTKNRKRSPSRVVAFVRADDQTRHVVAELIRRLVNIGESIGVMSDSIDHSFDPSVAHVSLIDESGDYVDLRQVREFVSQWRDVSRVFIVIDKIHPQEKLDRLIALSDSVFYLSTTAKSDETKCELEDAIEQSPSWKKKFHLIWVLDGQESAVPFVPELPNLVERDFKIQASSLKTATTRFDQGIDRIVHYLRGVSVGLALSGGAAHGMSHLGVLKALEDSGITIDVIAGTSAGVLTGVIYCAGYSPDWGIEHFTHDLAPGSIFNHLPMGDGLYMLKQFRSHKWEQMLRNYLFDWRLEQLPIPVNTITTDLISARSVVRSTGDAVNALLESINLPVISAPICRDGMLLVDGGILNNLPADELVKMGCNMIIGVDVSANIEHRVGDNTPETPTAQMKSPNAITTLLRCLNVQAHSMSSKGAEPADVIITPNVSCFDSTAFTKTPQMSEIGYQSTMEMIPRIRDVLTQLDHALYAR